jgi:HAD superfamily phosphoserine phosphatase-like hydrolase
MTKKLVLFDFDGTITTSDTLLQFLIFYKGYFRFLAGMMLLSPVLLLYIFKLIPNWKGKQICLRYFLGGDELDYFNGRCREFSDTILPALIRPDAEKAILQYKQQNAIVAVVSASAENWIRPWCEKHGILCIGTQLEVKDNKLTGNFCGANCYGPEKVKRIEKQFLLSDYQEIIAYGDSSGDKEMFGIAHQQHFKPFRA